MKRSLWLPIQHFFGFKLEKTPTLTQSGLPEFPPSIDAVTIPSFSQIWQTWINSSIRTNANDATDDDQPVAAQLDMPPVPLETSPHLVILSRIDQLINNTCTPNITLWKPDALHRCPTSNWPFEHSLLSVHHLVHETSIFAYLATIPHHLNNPFDNHYDTL